MDKTQFDAIPKKDRIRYLSGTLFYSCVHTVNRSAKEKFNAPLMYVTTVVLDKENQALAESWGLTINHPKEGEKQINGPFVVIKRKVYEDDEESINKAKPDVIDSNQNPIPPNILIGNGSKGTVKFGTYWYENNGGGVGSTLFALQVNELVPYVAKGDPNFQKTTEGFVVDDFSDIAEASKEEPVAEEQAGGLFD